MRAIFFVIIITVLLSVNYLSGWSYDHIKEDFSGRNDSVRVMVSHKYASLNPLKWLFLGENYRREWATPVSLPVFHLDRCRGGVRILRLGGGEQTKSLHLLDTAGNKWVLRMVDKDVRSAMPEHMSNTLATSIVQDQVSAAYPFAPLTIADLSAAVCVPCDRPELFFVSDDSALGKYRGIFKNTVCFLEKDMPPASTPFRINTADVKSRLLSTDSCQVLQERVFTARLLDMLIGDWDRHDRQWDWSWADSGHVHYIFPIPEDRDQAFFYSHGLLAHLVRKTSLPQLIGFRETSDHLTCLNHKIIPFDRYFLSGLSRQDWLRLSRAFCREITDGVIHSAVGKLPRQIYELSGRSIERKLISRRNGLVANVMDYYGHVAASVPVHTSREPETFQIRQSPGHLEITIWAMGDRLRVYHRIFYKGETKEVSLEDLGPEDHFDIRKSGYSGIKLLFNGRDRQPYNITQAADSQL